MTPIAHWDDVDIEELETGRLQELGAAAGSRRLSLDRIRVPAHGEIAPPAGHRREQLHFVLAGSGTLTGADVGPGQTVLYRPDEEVEPLVAGRDGLDLLMFSVAAGEAAPSHPGPRPPRVVALPDIELEENAHETHQFGQRDIGGAIGVERAGLAHMTIRSASEGFPPHCHSAEEELFIVLSGNGQLFLDDEEHAVRAGTVISRPAGTGISHSFVADPDSSLTVLAYGERRTEDIVLYRRTGLVWIRGLRRLVRSEPREDYWSAATS
ncbi:MAG TPA: cupin domain-containing protein [Solirubrobacteraceae bacterium]|jgi:uncharacterized cupin superfamily protein